jgi:hypothetical protein
MKGKYIIREYGAVMFNDCYNHNDFGNERCVTSAGFFCVNFDVREPQGIKVTCWGESTTLGKKSDPINDAKKIKRLICNLSIEDEI